METIKTIWETIKQRRAEKDKMKNNNNNKKKEDNEQIKHVSLNEESKQLQITFTN